jgi:outer membrane immunogenic protein
MKLLHAALLSTSSAVLMCGAAAAADLYDVPVIVDQTTQSSWEGFHVGVQAGLVSIDSHEYYEGDPDTVWNIGASGGLVGVFAGYDFQLADSFVLGVGGELNFVNAAGEYDGYDDYLTMDWQGAVRARLGMLVNPDALVYATLGYSWAGFGISEDYWGSGYDAYEFTAEGTQVGVGIDVKLQDNMFVRAEGTATFYDFALEDDDEAYYVFEPAVLAAKIGIGWTF